MVTDNDSLDQTLKRLFGSPVRARLAHWILARPDGAFFQLEAQDAMRSAGIAPSAVTVALGAFVDEELLSREPIGMRVYFRPQQHPAWPAFEAIAQLIEAP